MEISNEVATLLTTLQQTRRELHQIPELGFEEYKTQEYITKYLKKLGIPYEDQIIKTGVIAFIKGEEGAKTLCFRADMDALSVVEKNDVPFKSLHENRMHACGHDGHMAILLGLAQYLAAHQGALKHNVVLLFQPAEEGPGGALPIIEGGYLAKYKVDEIYGLHLFPGLPEGTMGVRPGAMLSQAGEFDLIINGRSGHGAMPHTAVDSMIVAAEMITGLQTIVSRSINPIEPAVLTIGRILGGERRNVIAKEVLLEGTVRSFSQQTYDTIKGKVKDYAKGMESIHDCEIEVVFRDMYPAVINDELLTREFVDCFPREAIKIIDPIMLAEDFSYYQREVPGLFFFLGCGNEEKNYCYPLHSDQFNFDEEVLGHGLQAYINLLMKRGALKSNQ